MSTYLKYDVIFSNHSNAGCIRFAFHDPRERLDPTLPYYELYKTDFDTFCSLHQYLSLWGGPNQSLLVSVKHFFCRWQGLSEPSLILPMILSESIFYRPNDTSSGLITFKFTPVIIEGSG
jgi:hypothetical protein